MSKHRSTRKIRIGCLQIGGDAPVAVQSMAATQTQNLEATARQIEILQQAGADVIRIAVDSDADVEALRTLRKQFPDPVLSVDLQENYKLKKSFSIKAMLLQPTFSIRMED